MTNSSTPVLPGPLLRQLKAKGQLLEPTAFLGKAGVSAEFQNRLNAELELRELVKVKFVAFKDEKKELAKQLATNTGSHLVMRVGNVTVLYRRSAEPANRKFEP